MAEEIKDTKAPEDTSTPEKPQEEAQKPEETTEQKKESTADVQALMVEIAKLKRANDKLSSEAADYKRKYRDTLSEQEQASMEKAEREAEKEEQYKRLLKENTVFKSEKNFLVLGYDEKQAHDAAVAQYDGDFDTLYRIQKDVQDSLITKQKEEWLKTRPQVQSGGSKEQEDLFLKGFNSVKQRI